MSTGSDIGGKHSVKDTAIFLGWIAAMILMGASCWILSQPFRTRSLVKAVNHVLEQSGDSRKLAIQSSSSAYFVTGTLFAMAEGRLSSSAAPSRQSGHEAKVFIFSFIGDGTFFPCAAVMSPDGKVEEFIPLNSHGERIIKHLPPGLLNVYARRIERIGS
ncbi:MAG: hypothetical protein LBH42_10690 [Treponema sp.]|jgi:hypothetical protein|nr:hypothetical protein [Treponema sp.]